MISYCKGQAGENEQARESGIKRVRERNREGKKKKKTEQSRGKGEGFRNILKEDASQEFLLIYLPICNLCGIMERGRGRGQKERERADRRVQRCVNRQEES